MRGVSDRGMRRKLVVLVALFSPAALAAALLFLAALVDEDGASFQRLRYPPGD